VSHWKKGHSSLCILYDDCTKYDNDVPVGNIAFPAAKGKLGKQNIRDRISMRNGASVFIKLIICQPREKIERRSFKRVVREATNSGVANRKC
jgi:hypothetical protein